MKNINLKELKTQELQDVEGGLIIFPLLLLSKWINKKFNNN